MEFLKIFEEANVVGFMLLFFRFAALFVAVPIFSHKNIPMQIKAAMALFFTIVFYPSMPPLEISITLPTIVLAVLSEFMLGLVVGIVLLLAYHVITFAGGIISFMMGFSMASAIDPQSGVSMPIISQFLSLMALMVLLSLNLHHWVLLFVDSSLKTIPLGGFIMQKNLFDYIIHAASNMFLVGFMIAFPIVALSWLADVIFGMLMKTMPQFNLLVIGFPIKIMVAFVVIIATFTSTMLIVKTQMLDAFNALAMFF
ncbi:flagellar type III secretion system protein FliR [Sulfurimonas sp. SAG-AH-194-L11]|nr:flagellar biosynthetic protein FliR [Sulfurimonas sp. SAG-AH-194-L11]MDF1876834.1 flagellar type III secretion system protein FliR [Sulfurimonas sp. SAG-AH-194-L11]